MIAYNGVIGRIGGGEMGEIGGSGGNGNRCNSWKSVQSVGSLQEKSAGACRHQVEGVSLSLTAMRPFRTETEGRKMRQILPIT